MNLTKLKSEVPFHLDNALGSRGRTGRNTPWRTHRVSGRADAARRLRLQVLNCSRYLKWCSLSRTNGHGETDPKAKKNHTLRNVTAGEGKETDFGYIIRVQFIY